MSGGEAASRALYPARGEAEYPAPEKPLRAGAKAAATPRPPWLGEMSRCLPRRHPSVAAFGLRSPPATWWRAITGVEPDPTESVHECQEDEP
jgi:hypothetical protein